MKEYVDGDGQVLLNYAYAEDYLANLSLLASIYISIQFPNIYCYISHLLTTLTMSQCTQATPTYQSMHSSGPLPIINVIVLAIIVPLQCLCFAGFCIYTKRKRKIIVLPHPPSARPAKQAKPLSLLPDQRPRRREQADDRNKQKVKNNQVGNQNKKQEKKASNKAETSRCTKLLIKIKKCLARCVSKNMLILLSVISIFLVVAALIMVGVSILPSEQALAENFPQAECALNLTVSNFVNGDDSWIGLSNLVPNLTKLQLNLNTRVKATKNSITALVLNGTNATFPVGFPNATRIFDTITNTNITATSVQTFIDARLRQWLFMNSTLSSVYRFPICQNTTISNIPHPINDGQTIELNYMASICNNLTQEVNQLVANGRAVDQLLVLTTSLENTRTSTNNNLTLYNNTISGISSRASQYTTQFNSTNINVTLQRVVPFALLGLAGLLFILTFVYICSQFYQLNKYLASQSDEEEDEDEDMEESGGPKNRRRTKNTENNGVIVSLQNISISAASELPPSQIRRQKAAKMKQIMRHGPFGHSAWTHAYNLVFLLTLFAIGFSTFSFTSFSTQAQGYCQSFASFLSGQKIQEAFGLSTSQIELLNPIQKCLSNTLAHRLGSAATGSHFLQTIQTQTYMNSIQQLYKVSAIYNATTPVNVLKSISLQQIQILKSYLLHMETMPVKSPDFTIEGILSQLNTFTNGSSISSRQKAECGVSLLRDQYVYNVVDCENTLINYNSENLVGESRCLQIPTWDGSGGSKQADLNDAQHTIQLNGTCPTIYDFYNGTNSACFLGKRLDLLRSANCTLTASQYNRRLKNLIKFSVETASYTNSYLQNLRNYFGVYSVLSTNLTQFFNGANTSAMLNQFGSLSNNLINKTSCSYVKSSVQAAYDAYCPQKNTIPMLLHDSYTFVLIAFGLGSLAWCFAVFQQLLALVYAEQFVMKIEEERQQGVQNQEEQYIRKDKLANFQDDREISGRERQQQQNRKRKRVTTKSQKLEISQQTLKNEDEDKIQRLGGLDIVENSERSNRHIDYLEVPPISRIKEKEEKQDSNDSKSSQPRTQQHEPQYQNEYLQNLQTGKKLLRRQDQTSRKQEEAGQEKKWGTGKVRNQGADLKKQQFIIKKTHNHEEVEDKEQNIFGLEEKQKLGFQTSHRPNRQIQLKTGYYPRGYYSREENQGEPNPTKNKKHPKIYQISSSEDSKKELAPPFFTKNQEDSRVDDFASRESYGKQRKVQSKAEVRRQTQNVRQQKNTKSNLSKVKKQGSENQRLRVIELDGILKQNLQEADADLGTQKQRVDKNSQQLLK